MTAELATEALHLLLLLSLPALGAAWFLGLLTGALQVVTQWSDAAIGTVPRVLAVGAALSLGAAWMGTQLLDFTRSLWTRLPELVP